MTHFVEDYHEVLKSGFAVNILVRFPRARVIREIEPLGFTLVQDSSSKIRNRVSMTLDNSVQFRSFDVATNDGLWPLGNTIEPLFGIKRPTEVSFTYFSLGEYYIVKPKGNRNSTGLGITLEGFDFSARISKNKFTDYFPIPSGTPNVEAINLILADRTVGTPAEVILDDSRGLVGAAGSSTTLLLASPGDDPWALIFTLASSMGAECFMNLRGEVILRKLFDSKESVITPIKYGSEGLPITSISKESNEKDGHNGVVLIQESSSNDGLGLRAESWNTNPDSITYYDPAIPSASSYGPHPLVEKVTEVVSQEALQQLADEKLANVVGSIEKVTVVTVPHPFHDIGDLLEIYDDVLNVDGQYGIEKLTLSIETGSVGLSISTSRRIS